MSSATVGMTMGGELAIKLPLPDVVLGGKLDTIAIFCGNETNTPPPKARAGGAYCNTNRLSALSQTPRP